MKPVNTFIFILFAVFFVSACKKKEPVETFHFYNLTGKPATAVLYGYGGDMLRGINPLKSINIPAGGADVALADLGNGEGYYIDYYTDDYSYSNWLHSEMPDYFKAAAYKSFTIDTLGSLRGVLLKNDKEQTWKAIDAYSATNPTENLWNTLTADGKKLTLTMGYSGYTFTQYSNGNPIPSSWEYTGDVEVSPLHMKIPQSDLLIYATPKPVDGKRYPNELLGIPRSKDTICMVYYGASIQYLMVRQ